MAPVNDAIANAIVISLPTSFSFDVTGASTAGGPYPAFEDWPDIWYRIEPAADILIGITVEQTGGAAPNGIEVDLYHLTGPDPPTDYNDLDFIDWAGDGTTGPTPDWQDGPTTYLKLTGGEIYYLDVQEYNYVTDDIQGTVTLTSAPPLVNDDWEDAIVINTPGGNSYVASTIGAQLQTGESFGFPHGINDGGSVWYRIVAQDAGPIQLSILHSSGYRLANGYRPRAVVYGPVAYPPANVAAIQGSTIVKTVTDQRNQAGANSSQAPYRASSTWEPWYVEWNATAGQSYYVRVTNESSWEREGTFDLRVTIPNYTTFTATSFMSGSGTVSNVAGWVRETQFRTPTDHDEWKGELDYIETLVISPGLTGDYALELHGRFGYTGGTAQHDLYVAVVKVNGVPVREGIQLNIFDNTTAGYISLTHDYCIGDAGAGSFGTVFARTTLPGQNGGGPRHLRLAAGDEVTIHLGSGFRAFEGPAAGNPTRYIEVDEIRFSPAGSYGDGTPTGWKLIKEEAEQGFSISQGVGMPGRAFGDELFILTDVDPGNANEFGGSAGRRGRTKFGVWRYQLVGGEITAPDLDLNLGASGGELMDIRLFPGDTSLVPFLRDLTILPNGDIYCLWTDGGQYLVMKKWDGAAWSLISDDVGGYGAPYSGWEINHVSMDNDGTDIYLVYGKNVTNGVFTWGAGNGFEWHCQFYDVSADTFTELGTGQTAFPASVLGTRSGDFDHPPRVKVSPGGVPWVIWCEMGPPTVGFPYEEYLWVYYWDGGAWVDAEMPHPTVPPPTIANSDYAAGTLASAEGQLRQPARARVVLLRPCLLSSRWAKRDTVRHPPIRMG